MAVAEPRLTPQQRGAKTRAAKNGGVHPGGRPEFPNKQEVQKRICELLSLGMSLHKICAMDGMPDISNVIAWRWDDPEFHKQYVRAREDQADYYADEITEIADTETDPNKARVRIDARKWVASKLKSKSYGDKVTNEITNKDGEAFEVKDSNADARRVAFMLGRAVGRNERSKVESDS
jgi:hypothetical protein